MYEYNGQTTQNNVINRFLLIQESVLQGLEYEPKIIDFTLIKEIVLDNSAECY